MEVVNRIGGFAEPLFLQRRTECETEAWLKSMREMRGMKICSVAIVALSVHATKKHSVTK